MLRDFESELLGIPYFRVLIRILLFRVLYKSSKLLKGVAYRLHGG